MRRVLLAGKRQWVGVWPKRGKRWVKKEKMNWVVQISPPLRVILSQDLAWTQNSQGLNGCITSCEIQTLQCQSCFMRPKYQCSNIQESYVLFYSTFWGVNPHLWKENLVTAVLANCYFFKHGNWQRSIFLNTTLSRSLRCRGEPLKLWSLEIKDLHSKTSLW